MASRTSGRGDERSSGRNTGAEENTTRRQSTAAQDTAGSARQKATSSASQSQSAPQGQSASRSQSQGQSAPQNQSASRSQSQSRDTQPQQPAASAKSEESQPRADQQRELRTSREQGNMRPAASSQRGNVGRESGGAGASSAGGNSNPFALMRRMMEDMDRIFSDFGFTTPGMFGSSLLSSDPASTGQRPQGTRPSGGSNLSATQRGQQGGVTRTGQSGGLQRPNFASLWAPQLEVFERANNLVVRAELPGLSREDVDVQLDDDALIIRGERRSDVDDESDGFYHSERSYGSFYRAIPLPEGIDASGCNATFKDGVLEVTLPKPPQQQSRSRRIDVR